MNKKAVGKIIIGGVSLGAIIIFFYQMIIANAIFDAFEPEIQQALTQLSDKVVCPPELKNDDFEICINDEGKLLLNGYVSQNFVVQTSSNQQCTIYYGHYEDTKICTDKNFQSLDLSYTYKATTFKIDSKAISFYIFNKQNLRFPLKKFLGIVKYIPK